MVYLTLKRKLEKIYDGNIVINKSGTDLIIKNDVGEEKSNTKDIAVYINTNFKMVVIWDLKGRRWESLILKFRGTETANMKLK